MDLEEPEELTIRKYEIKDMHAHLSWTSARNPRMGGTTENCNSAQVHLTELCHNLSIIYIHLAGIHHQEVM
jgi:hypothetical protein